jgi:large subunit ribosomal protein L1
MPSKSKSSDAKPEDKQAQASADSQLTDLVHDETAPDLSAVPSPKEPTKVTKAGPRSRKALDEAEAEAERKAKAATKATEAEAPKPKPSQPNPLKKHGKAYREAAKLVDRTQLYDLEAGLELAKQTVKVKFDPSIEMHFNLGVDPQHADQMVRSSVVLPAGTGKSLRVAVLTTGDKQAAAKAAGADVVGEADLIAQIEKGKLDFDRLIATPDVMPKLSKLAKILGPRGLMPNPKSGTVTADPAKAVKEAKAGKVEFRIDKQGIIHQVIGKASFSAADLLANAKALIDAIQKAKPAASKGTYVKAVTIASSMGPGIKLDPSKVVAVVSSRTKTGKAKK